MHGTGSTTIAQTIYFGSKALIFAFPLGWWFLVESRSRARGDSKSSPVAGNSSGAADFSPRGSSSNEEDSRLVKSRGLKPAAPWDVAAGVTTGVAIAMFLWAVYLLAFRDLIDVARLEAQVKQFGVYNHYILYALFLSIINSGLEEYYWRWFVFGRLKAKVNPPAAVVLSSVAFAAHHFVALQSFFGSFVLAGLFSIGIAGGGAIWACHYHRTGRLWGVWVSHCIVDMGALSVGYHLLF